MPVSADDKRFQTEIEASGKIDTSVEGSHLPDSEVLRPSTCSDSRLSYTLSDMELECAWAGEDRWDRRCHPLLLPLLEEVEDPLSLERWYLSFASSLEPRRR